LLYVLLAGQSPRATAQVTSLDELRAAAMREPPSLASTGAESNVMSVAQLRKLAAARSESAGRLLKTLRGELDNIVRKALAVEPQDRYLTVGDFAMDIRRYLRNEPVMALPDSVRSRAKKFVQRHRGSVLTATLTPIALLAAATITTLQSIEAARQRDIAIQQQERVLASNDFLNMLLGELGPGGEKMSLQELLDRGVKVIDEQYGTNERTTGMTLYDVSILYGRLGQLETQISLLDRSEAIGRNVGEDKLVANALCAKARLKIDGDASASAADLQAGLAIRDRLPRSDRSGIIECYRAAALAQSTDGNNDGAIDTYRSAINILDEAPVSSPSLRLLLLNDVAEQYFITDRAADALEILDEVIAYDEELGRERTVDHVIYLVNRSAVLSRFGEVLQASIGQQEAMQRVEGMDQAPVAIGGHYGNSLLRLGRYDEAIALLEAEYAPALASGNKRWQGQLALLIASALVRSNRLDEAEVKLGPGARRRPGSCITRIVEASTRATTTARSCSSTASSAA
jgi:tetratricopeptide (TPR) repeat protein